jgi:hypothetical protein
MTTQTIFRTVNSTSQSTDLSLLQNAGSTAPGDPILGLAFNTASLGAQSRVNATGALTSVTLATQTVTGAYSSGGFVQVSSASAPGQYRFDIPNGLLTAVGEVNITFSGAPAGTVGNMETHTLKIIVTAVDLFTAGGGILSTQLTESYAALGVAPTAAQALMLIQQLLTDFSITGTVQTVTKLDGATTAATLTLNNAANPTGITRAS